MVTVIVSYFTWCEWTLKSTWNQNLQFILVALLVLRWTINLCKLIHWKNIVLVIFNQNVIICFCSGMAFLLWWPQFDRLGRKSLTLPLQLLDCCEWKMSAKIKPHPLFNIPFQLEMSPYWNEVSSNFLLMQTLIEKTSDAREVNTYWINMYCW